MTLLAELDDTGHDMAESGVERLLAAGAVSLHGAGASVVAGSPRRGKSAGAIDALRGLQVQTRRVAGVSVRDLWLLAYL